MYNVNFTGGYIIKKAVFPYTENIMHEFDQSAGEVTDFKIMHEYLFTIVRSYNSVTFILSLQLIQKNVSYSGSQLFVSYRRQPFVQAKFIPPMDGSEVDLQMFYPTL